MAKRNAHSGGIDGKPQDAINEIESLYEELVGSSPDLQVNQHYNTIQGNRNSVDVEL